MKSHIFYNEIDFRTLIIYYILHIFYPVPLSAA